MIGLTEAFVYVKIDEACRADDRPSAHVVREFMSGYFAERLRRCCPVGCQPHGLQPG